jgi:hypothetical protein
MSLWKEIVSWKSKQKKREMQDRIKEKGFEEFFISTGLIIEGFNEILDLLCGPAESFSFSS